MMKWMAIVGTSLQQILLKALLAASVISADTCNLSSFACLIANFIASKGGAGKNEPIN
jgi:hypothetical protein